MSTLRRRLRARRSARPGASPLLAAVACVLASCPAASAATAPSVSALEANNGPAAGGATVVIHGTRLTPVGQVIFGTSPSPKVTAQSETTIAAVSPSGSGEVEVRVVNSSNQSSPAVPADRYAYDPKPTGPWLGLNGNSVTYLGSLEMFVEHKVVYDRSAGIEWKAGGRLSEPRGEALARSIGAGMIPVITVEFAGYSRCSWHQECLPTGKKIARYVKGFVRSANEVLARYPAAPIVFEAINEPWGFGSAAQYADVLAQLLPAAQRAGIPPERIYAAATGSGWVRSLYREAPALQEEVKGWYLHPYGPPTGGEGIQSLPAIQAEMTSGQSNLLVSEAGYCAPDVNGSARECQGAGPAYAPNSAAAASDLTEMLDNALPYRRAGWLRALLVYSRNSGGWAMQQLPGPTLTAQGKALIAFADAHG